MRRTKAAASAAVVLGLLASAQAAVPEGQPFLIELPPNVLGADVGAAGFVVLANLFGGDAQALTWMPTSGTTPLGGTAGIAISRDGRTIVGRALDAGGFEHAAIWAGGTQWRLLDPIVPNAQPCDRLVSGSFGASDDGRVVVGLGWNGCNFARAVRWEEGKAPVDLGSTVPGRSSRANNVSGDGCVVVGWQEVTGPRLGAKWVDGTQTMIEGPHGNVGEAFAANRDGSLIVGANCNFADPTPSAWTWTAVEGVRCFPVDLRVLPIVHRQALMLATSEDGRVIGGALSFGLESESLVWFDGEPFLLKDYLRQNGVPNAFEGWVNTGFVLGVTPDGRTLVGYGAGSRTFQGYMVVLPELGDR